MLLRSLGILVIVSSAGCSLDRLALGPGTQRDASMMLDAGWIDAGPELDAGDHRDADEPRPDAGERDAAIDAFVPVDAGPCVGGPDDDGDGVPDACDLCASGDDALDADGDRVPDACDLCASGDDAQDRDGDGTPDACDGCPDGNDALDGDGDGTPDGCDDWPCGVRPSIPRRVNREWITISEVSIDGGGNTAVVRAGMQYEYVFSFEIDDTACGGCTDQIEIGTEPGGRRFCAYDANPPGTGASGTRMRTWTAPSSTGIIDLRFNLGQNFSCNEDGADDWWEGAPPPDHTFGVLCVVP